MPRPRSILPALASSSHYHCLSRVVDRNFVFHEHERDVFRKVLRQVEAFSGVRVLTWTILSNHFHVLVEVPPRPEAEPGDAEILERCRDLYSAEQMIAIEWEFAEAKRDGGRGLKQKFTLWFNREHERVGVLWESRFKSVIVEGHWNSLLKVAAYIDLNSVRAGMVDDPKDYRWCGYGEAVAGDRAARRGLSGVLVDLKPKAHWGDIGPRYRKILFGIGEESATRVGLSRVEVAKVWAAGGKLSLAQLLRCQVRYLSDGFAVGRESFVESVIAVLRENSAEGQKGGARRMLGGAGWGDMWAGRGLRVRSLGFPHQVEQTWEALLEFLQSQR